jgi:predicted nucleotide-binding protein
VTKQERYLFVTYSRSDTEIVSTLVAGLEDKGIKTWLDITKIKPGENWDESIEKALKNAAGMLVFLSKASVTSANVMDEVAYMIENKSFVILILIEKDISLPSRLENLQYVDLSDISNKSNLKRNLHIYTGKIILRLQAFRTSDNSQKPVLHNEDITRIANSMAEEKRATKSSSESSDIPNSLFIVHGKDVNILTEVESYIAGLGIKPIVLTKIQGAEKSLFQKFLTWSSETKYAIVLISADDLGASREQYEIPEVGNHSLQFRARQNVILELGFFYGYLGWERVFVMFKTPDKLYPNFEYPSDLLGVVFDPLDKEGKWKKIIEKRIKEAGFIIK